MCSLALLPLAGQAQGKGVVVFEQQPGGEILPVTARAEGPDAGSEAGEELHVLALRSRQLRRAAQAQAEPVAAASIREVSLDGNPVARGSSFQFPSNGVLAILAAGGEGSTLQVAFSANGTLSKQTSIVAGTAASITATSAEAAGKSLVLVQDGRIVDTYCSFT